MIDMIIVGAAVMLSLLYTVVKVVRFIRRPAGSSACGCSSSDCGNCPMVKKDLNNHCT